MTRIGLGLPGLSIAEVASAAEAATQYDFDSFSLYGDLGDLPPYAALHACADQLKSSAIGNIGPMGIPANLIHPELIAAHAVALEQQLPGQTSLGLVRGAFMDRIGEQPANLQRIEQAVYVARRTFAEKDIDVPLYVGGYGPKLLALAGRLGVAGVKLGGSVNPRLAAVARETIANPNVSLVLGAVTVINPDRLAARRLARHEVAKYLRVVGRFDSTLDGDERASLSEFEQRFDVADPAASDAISDSLLDKFALAGTADEALAAIGKMGDSVDRFEFGTPHGLRDRAGAIRYIGEHIVGELE